MPTVNIGILAHVDAGKTSLTERLLFDTGVIGRLGSVDAGDTQTDTGDIERRRGITIRSAVASFTVGALRVNLIDTPGHPDFVAEVERALGVLDGAVLVVSAVEGVQAQTRVLMRALRRAGLPTLIFVNKIDRSGARYGEILSGIRRVLAPRVVCLTSVRGLGTAAAVTSPRPPDAETLADADDGILAALVGGSSPAAGTLWAALAAQTASGQVHPVFFGSALGGQGVAELVDGIGRLLPPARDSSGGTRGTVFAIERGTSGEKVAYVRLRSGELRPRQEVTFRRREPDGTDGEYTGRITGLDVIGASGPGPLTAGDIAKVRGLAGVRVGDEIGGPPSAPHFAPPGLETVVRARRPEQAARLHAALVSLADQDPLIRTRTVPGRGTSVLLYGEVQKEVIGATLAENFGVSAVFEPSRTVYLERPAGSGSAVEEMGRFPATVGLRVSPGPPGSGIAFRREVELGALPHAFDRAILDTVHQSLEQGLYGWPVTDCVVTLTRSGYDSPVAVAADFRELTPLVLMRALAAAGTRVHEPCHTFELEIPLDTLSPVTVALTTLTAHLSDTSGGTTSWTLKGTIPVARIHELRQRLPGLSHGEADWTSAPSGDRPVTGPPPTRERTDGNPLDRTEYLHHLTHP